ncbi:hypothetical protein JY651_03315 [Pyxidicoccus parkwayensis]|uniref:MFS transporter n=1 Tax=Pyxidicoccus parkwayensis TaxID=2813578 RepID=A0ABX7P020_9BACT|nr:hypothetical protein [Pyxidicoccus parkwaysis]QSQ24021.1 hypothetical protein JY651_03315 [Pyxidicoccus parkwaysis]
MARRRRTQRGHVFLGLLVLLGLLAAGISWLVWRPPDVGPALAWLIGGLVVAGWSALAFWRRDAFAAAKLLLFCTVMPAIFCVLWVFNAHSLGGPATWGGGASAVGAALLGRYLWREWRRVEVLPNVLLDAANKEDICELDGLQLCAGLLRPEEGPVPLELRILVQSCVDAERTLTVRLSGPSKTRVHYPDRVTVQVGPGEVGRLVVPLHPLPGARAGGTLHLGLNITGPGGPRLRFWRARPYVARIHPVMQVLALLAGMITWGGGWSVEVPVLPDAPPPRPQLPPERWTVVWRPGLEQLHQARAA